MSEYRMSIIELRKLCKEREIKWELTDKKSDLLTKLGFENKKGKPTWKPAAKLSVVNKRGGFRYRWCDKDQLNIQRKTEEGWVFVNKDTGLPVEHDNPDGNPLTSATEYRELVVMALDEETAQARDEYFQERTREQTVGLKKRLQEDLDEEAKTKGGYRTTATGSIVID